MTFNGNNPLELLLGILFLFSYFAAIYYAVKYIIKNTIRTYFEKKAEYLIEAEKLKKECSKV